MKTIKLLLAITLALAGQVQAQTSNLVTTLVMQFSSAQNLTTPVLPRGGSYFFLVTGRYGTAPFQRGDAMSDAAFNTVDGSTLDQYHVPNYGGWQWNGMSTNRPTPDVYQTNHVYTFQFQGRGAAEVLAFTDSIYGDNVGSLTFELYEIVQAQTFLTNGLVAYYPFNGNANDTSGNGHNGIVQNATPATDRFGNSNACYQFSSSWIFVPYSPSLYPSNQTISVWFKNTGVYHDTSIMRAGNVYDDNLRGYGIYTMDLYTTFGAWYGNGINWSTTTYTKTPIGQWPLNTWAQLIMSRGSNSAALYLNGQLISSVTNASNYVPVQFSPLYIGSGEAPGKNGADTLPTDVPGSFWHGSIDDIRIYNRALSDSEVQQLYAYESTPPQPPTNGLVAYYPFNGNANDESGNGNNGVVNGAVPITNRFGMPSSAYSFYGSNSIVVPYNANLFPQTQTISIWLESAAFAAVTVLRNGSLPADGWRGYSLGSFNFNSEFGFQDYTGSGYAAQIGLPNASWPANEWFQLVYVRTATTAQLFQNGQLVAQATNLPSNVVSQSSPLFIGSNAAGAVPNSYFYLGAIDDIRIYNRALSTNEVQELYAYESAPITPPPSITSQPVSQSINQGSPVSFRVTATGTGLGFQWQLNSVNISEATNASYSIASATTNDAGNYTVIVSNAGGSVTSSNAVLTVILPPRTGTGTATLSGVFVVAVNIIDGGSGYTNAPLIRLVGGGGSGAQAFAVVSNGVITAITMLDAGYGYTSAPLVVIDPPFIPNPVLGIAPMSFLTFSNLTVGGAYQLQRSVGWYWTNQPVSFTAADVSYTEMVAGVAGSGDYRLALNPVPAQAFATATVDYGFVVQATVTSGGSGYVTSPAISIVGGGGTNATAVANLSGGVVTSITITDAGIGYTNTPTVQIAQPPAAAVSPTVLPVMRVDAASLAPYNSYQIQFKPALGGAWGNWNGGLFTPTDVTNSQYLFITNGVGFFRLQHAP